MKTLFAILIILTGTVCVAQDMVVTMKRDTIYCNVYFVDRVNEYLAYMKNDTAIMLQFKNLYYYKLDDGEEFHTPSLVLPGDHLIKARHCHWASWGCFAASVGLAIYATNNDADGLLWGSFALGLIGIGFDIASWHHVGEAGKKMNTLHFGASATGLSLRYKF